MKMNIEGLDKATKAHEIYPMVEFLHDLMAERRYSDVDDILENTPIETFSLCSMCSFIRTTCAMKRHLTKWEFARDRIAIELTRRGEDAAQMLRGLYGNRVPDCAELHKMIGLEAP